MSILLWILKISFVYKKEQSNIRTLPYENIFIIWQLFITITANSRYCKIMINNIFIQLNLQCLTKGIRSLKAFAWTWGRQKTNNNSIIALNSTLLHYFITLKSNIPTLRWEDRGIKINHYKLMNGNGICKNILEIEPRNDELRKRYS